jgi:3-hydroxybutyryl-CoA dehydrogenase
MNILVIGEPENLDECRAKFGDRHVYLFEGSPKHADAISTAIDVVFDFDLKNNPTRLDKYKKSSAKIFVDTSEISLIHLLSKVGHEMQCALFGFCGMPTLFNRTHLEISLSRKNDEDQLKDVCKNLNTDFLIVEDKTGLVTPRIICMLINEAYFTVEEQIASRADIDEAMKLGTNYPFGPFEWSKKIGIKKICDILEAVHKETNDERYKICSLLKAESDHAYK